MATSARRRFWGSSRASNSLNRARTVLCYSRVGNSQMSLPNVADRSFASKAVEALHPCTSAALPKADVNSPPWLPPLSATSRPEQVQQAEQGFAVGTRVTSRPPPRSVRAAFPHTAPTSGIDGKSVPYTSQRPVPRLPGSKSGACFVGAHSPRPLPFAPPTPQQYLSCFVRRLPSYYGMAQTSHARASSATAPHLPDADRPAHATSDGQTRDLPASDAIPLHVMWP